MKYGDETVIDILCGQWSWCKRGTKINNSNMAPLDIEYKVLSDIYSEMQRAIKNSKLIEKKEKQIKNVETKKNIAQINIEAEIKKMSNNLLQELGYETDVVIISRRDKLLLDLLPRSMADNYESWIDIGYVLHDMFINDKQEGLKIYHKFSSLSSKYNEAETTKQFDYYDKSRKEMTIGKIHYHFKTLSPNIYKIYNLICSVMNLEFTDAEYGRILYEKYKEDYVCASFKPSDTWYHFKGGIYTELDSKAVIEALVITLKTELMEMNAALTIAKKIYSNDDEQLSYYSKLSTVLTQKTLYTQSAKGMENIYRASKMLFYIPKFEDGLNQKPHLFSFGEYLYDTTILNFRLATKEDMISIKCGMTKEECIESDTKGAEDFLKSIFPITEQYEYMKTLLSDSIYGKNKQRFGVHMGIGANGKGILETLMAFAFGQYYGTMNAGYITSEDENATKAANPQLYDCRYVRSLWFSEPTEGKPLNGSVMKSLGSNDVIKARALYKAPVSFRPQFSIYISCNTTFKLQNVVDASLPRRIKFNKFTQHFTSNPDPNNPNHKKPNKKLDKLEYQIELSRSLMKLLLEHYKKININPKDEEEDDEPQICKTWKAEFIAVGDSFGEFLDDNYEVTHNKDDYIKINEFMMNYLTFCRNNRYKALEKNIIINKLSALFPKPEKYFKSRTSKIVDNKKIYLRNIFCGIKETVNIE